MMQLLLLLVSLFKMARSVLVNEVRAMANKPYQPTHLSFPARSFGKTVVLSRSFQAFWFNGFSWLDGAFCFICCKAVNENKVNIPATVEQVFLVSEFTNRKDATRNFENHQKSGFHALSNLLNLRKMPLPRGTV